MVSMPNVLYQRGRPILNDQVSVSRYGKKAIAFVEYGDSFWTVDVETQPLYDFQLAQVMAFISQVKKGNETVVFNPIDKTVPQAYWDDPTNPIPNDNGTLGPVTNGKTAVIQNISPGLILMPDDKISFASGAYRQFVRVITGATAVSTQMTVTVDPPIMSYITSGATVKFKNPEMNTRMVPGSFQLGDEPLPTVSFQLIEVPQ
ncbi:hypothetical protein C5748_18485 [Phyllobacterium phragmitis]|uniref:Uncharacterized protein n=1 Tax=Phyllobacterium phragmitis TaxID=2670329 RepID=A0A2S9INM8_9HYPH|nr:hypothetical protein [Phyllobacterium phragmitis]PRD42136.1 hypothetical protein C5748_18485 [Phyllobacterium phragmitis]